MDPFVGEIRAVAFNFPPVGWALCNGAILSISSNTPLFSLLGTSFGGNGISNFALPDLCGRMAVNQGQGPGLSVYIMGEQEGGPSHTLVSPEMAIHSHVPRASSAPGSTVSPAGAFWAGVDDGQGETISSYVPSAAPVDLRTVYAQYVQVIGQSQAFPLAQPTLALNYIIALQGIFPQFS